MCNQVAGVLRTKKVRKQACKRQESKQSKQVVHKKAIMIIFKIGAKREYIIKQWVRMMHESNK